MLPVCNLPLLWSIRAVGVVVPAHDEETRIRACVESIRRALHALPAGVDTAVTVVLDRCRDRTPQVVESIARHWPGLRVLHATNVGSHGRRRIHADRAGVLHLVPGSGVGALRDLGVRHTLDTLRAHPPSVWLLNTDADTVVPSTWALDHLRFAAQGIVAVAGMADLDTVDHLSPHARHDYLNLMAERVNGARHVNVYGANLGVRADAYLEVGGFPLDGVGEDHLLWNSLRTAGLPTEQPSALRVTTSARLHGRATGGLADLLHGMHETTGDGTTG